MYKLKRNLTVAFIIALLFFSTVTVNATVTSKNEYNQNQVNTEQNESQNTTEEKNTSKPSTTETLVDMKEEQEKNLESMKAKYGSDTYGMVAYILYIIQKYSIPIGIVGIAICGVYEYVIGMKRLDIRDKGFNTMIAVITIMIICQILPLVFAVVVKSTD